MKVLQSCFSSRSISVDKSYSVGYIRAKDDGIVVMIVLNNSSTDFVVLSTANEKAPTLD